jgi:hypothetical protein
LLYSGSRLLRMFFHLWKPIGFGQDRHEISCFPKGLVVEYTK